MNTITLSGAKNHLTDRPGEALLVREGVVFVYIVPMENGQPGRRCLLCEAQPGDTLPALCFQDGDGQQWRFLLRAQTTAVLEPLASARAKAAIESFVQKNALDQTHFCDSAVDLYRMRLVQEDGFILRTAAEKENMRRRADRLVSSESAAQAADEDGATEHYSALALLCRSVNIPIEPWERVRNGCRIDPDIADIARFCRIPCREVSLEDGWFQDDAGFLIAYTLDGAHPVACVPFHGGYRVAFPGQKPVRLTKRTASALSPKAWQIYRPFPQKEMDARAFFRFCAGAFSKKDAAISLLMCALCSAMSLLPALYSRVAFRSLLPAEVALPLWQLCLLLCMFALCSIVYTAAEKRHALRLQSRVHFQAQNAAFHRVFSLPEGFFARFDSADIARRVLETGVLAGDGVSLLYNMAASLISGAVCFAYLLFLSRPLALICLAIALLFGMINTPLERARSRRKHSAEAHGAQADSVLYQYLDGIEKIRLSGMEERAAYEYLLPYSQKRRDLLSRNKLLQWQKALSSACAGAAALALCAFSCSDAGMDSSALFAFAFALAPFFRSMHALCESICRAFSLPEAWRRVAPLFSAAPESVSGTALPGDVRGCIDIERVSFSYEPEEPVLQNIDLHIHAGEYIAIVGASGSGKTTLLRLLLGFETPRSGRIYYDGQDMHETDLALLRSHFGVVLQSDSLISGTILENITLTKPDASLEEAARAAADAGILDDILTMPMNFQTIVNERSSTLSGGQIQRILIARALLARPSVLFFDEATSALDNIAQKTVCDTLEKLSATRIVVAHRLSTVRRCDRIVVLEQGKIVQQGTFEQLCAADGPFARLAAGQTVD